MKKIPLYSKDKNFYLYFDTDEKKFYRALNESMFEQQSEKKLLSNIAHIRKFFPIVLPILLIVNGYFTKSFESWTNFSFNCLLLTFLTMCSLIIFFYFSKNFSLMYQNYLAKLDFFEEDYSLEEISQVIRKTKAQCSKVRFIRLCSSFVTFILGGIFLQFSNLLILTSYLIVLIITVYILIITSTKSYSILKQNFSNEI